MHTLRVGASVKIGGSGAYEVTQRQAIGPYSLTFREVLALVLWDLLS